MPTLFILTHYLLAIRAVWYYHNYLFIGKIYFGLCTNTANVVSSVTLTTTKPLLN